MLTYVVKAQDNESKVELFRCNQCI